MISYNSIKALDRYHFLNKKMRESLVKNPKYAYWYARDIIKGRWPEAEQYIRNDEEINNLYKKMLLNLKNNQN